MALDPNGDLVVADAENNRVRKVCMRSGQVVTLAGSGVPGFKDSHSAMSAQFNHPQGLAVAGDGTVLVADLDNHRIRQVSPKGVVTTLAGTSKPGGCDAASGLTSTLLNPVSVAITTGGQLLVAETSSCRLRLVRTQLAVPSFLVQRR